MERAPGPQAQPLSVMDEMGFPCGHPVDTPERPATQLGWGCASLRCQAEVSANAHGGEGGQEWSLGGSQQPGDGRLTFSDEKHNRAAGGLASNGRGAS